MTDALRAAKRHLAELAANGVPARDKPSALHRGLITTLVDDLERFVGASPAHACEQCGEENGKPGRFCSEPCRARWHREHDPRGVVKTVRKLKDGSVAIVAHFPDPDAERALRFLPGRSIVMGEV